MFHHSANRIKLDILNLIERYPGARPSWIPLISLRFGISLQEAQQAVHEVLAESKATDRAQSSGPDDSENRDAFRDREAIRAFMARYRENYPALVVEVAAKYSNRIVRQDAEDLIHEALLRLKVTEADTLGPVDENAYARGYALFRRVIRNLFIDLYWRRSGRRPISLEAASEDSCAIDPPEPRFGMREKDNHTWLSTLLAELEPGLSPFLLRFEGLCRVSSTLEATRLRLLDSAALFGHNDTPTAAFVFCHGFLHSDSAAFGLPDHEWVKAYLRLHLQLTSNTADQRKHRLKAAWDEARAAQIPPVRTCKRTDNGAFGVTRGRK